MRTPMELLQDLLKFGARTFVDNFFIELVIWYYRCNLMMTGSSLHFQTKFITRQGISRNFLSPRPLQPLFDTMTGFRISFSTF